MSEKREVNYEDIKEGLIFRDYDGTKYKVINVKRTRAVIEDVSTSKRWNYRIMSIVGSDLIGFEDLVDRVDREKIVKIEVGDSFVFNMKKGNTPVPLICSGITRGGKIKGYSPWDKSCSWSLDAIFIVKNLGKVDWPV